MNYQDVRAKFEAPLATAYGALSPAVPIYFDNFIDVLSDTVDEFVHVNIQFGLTTESTLTTSHDQIRGVIVVRVFTEKGKGPARNQTLLNTATTSIQTINNTAKTSSGVYAKTGSIEGPTFTDEGPFFVSRIETGFQATFIS
tara:strand:+ start:1050 stop:1475 length:426 start_codon:yes stop_codon:yes gene_type:complete